MATGSSLEKELTCDVCFDIYEDPHVLKECLHTYCLKCIKQLELTQMSHKIRCPDCRTLTKRKDIKPDFKTQRLIEIHNSQQESEALQALLCQPSSYTMDTLSDETCEPVHSVLDMHHCDMCQRTNHHCTHLCTDCEIYDCSGCKRDHKPNIKLVGYRKINSRSATVGSVGASSRATVVESVGENSMSTMAESVGANSRATVVESVGANSMTTVAESVGANSRATVVESVGANSMTTVAESVGANSTSTLVENVGANSTSKVVEKVGANSKTKVVTKASAKLKSSSNEVENELKNIDDRLEKITEDINVLEVANSQQFEYLKNFMGKEMEKLKKRQQRMEKVVIIVLLYFFILFYFASSYAL